MSARSLRFTVLFTLVVGTTVATTVALAQKHPSTQQAAREPIAAAYETPKLECEQMPLGSSVVKQVGLGPYRPQYFITAIGNDVGVISPGSGNRFVSMASGRQMRIPGDIDPVATADHEFVTIPYYPDSLGGGVTFPPGKGGAKPTPVDDSGDFDENEMAPIMAGADDDFLIDGTVPPASSRPVPTGDNLPGMAFYATGDFNRKLAEGADLTKLKPDYVDPAMDGNYQSTGIVSKRGDTTRHRVFVGTSHSDTGYAVRDYDVRGKSFTPVQPRPVDVCGGLN